MHTHLSASMNICVMLTAVKINTMKNVNNPLRRDYNEELKNSQ